MAEIPSPHFISARWLLRREWQFSRRPRASVGKNGLSVFASPGVAAGRNGRLLCPSGVVQNHSRPKPGTGRVVAGIFLVAIVVAVFLAKPITVEADARDRPDRVATCGWWTRPNVAVLNSLIERRVRLPGNGYSATRPANLGQWRVKTALPLAGVVALHYHVGITTMGTACRYKAVIALLSRSYSKRRSRFRS
jgi:hypothetical protein